MMYTLVRGLVLLNDANLFDELLRDENVFDVVGALEYDPEYSEAEETSGDGVGDAGERTGVGAQQKVQHRAFLRDSVVFKEVVPIQDPAIRAKIHQTYRIGYLKDVILPRVLDDATFGTLTSIMLFNNVEVVLALQQDPAFLKELFNRLKSTPRAPRRRLSSPTLRLERPSALVDMPRNCAIRELERPSALVDVLLNMRELRRTSRAGASAHEHSVSSRRAPPISSTPSRGWSS